MFNYIKENLDFDQLYTNLVQTTIHWVHFSYVSEDKNRNRILRAVRDDGKTKYIDITNETNLAKFLGVLQGVRKFWVSQKLLVKKRKARFGRR